MSNFFKGCFLLLLVSILAGCGGGTNGNGNTVYITSSLKQGKTGAVFANFSGAVFANSTSARFNPVQSANSMNFTIKSTPYTTSGDITNSNVVINNISFAFTPVLVSPGVPPTFTPSHPSVSYSGLITPGGSLDIENVPVLWDDDIRSILAGLGTRTGTFQYNVDVTFSGVETNTGKGLSTTSKISAFLQKK